MIENNHVSGPALADPFSCDDLTVVIVEDEPLLCEMITTWLSKLKGVACVTAHSASEGIEILKTRKVSLVLLDWWLGSTNGAEVLRACWRSNPLMPVIVMSGLTSIADVRTDAFVEGAVWFMEKPFSETIVKNCVKQWLYWVSRPTLMPERREDVVTLEEMKRIYIRNVVRLFNDNLSQAAEKLGMNRGTVSLVVRGASPSPTQPPVE
jgi:DNA-binding NtrC family response regulator